MTTPDKRARETRKAQKKREKAARRSDKRDMGPQEIQVVTADDIQGDVRSIAETMQEIGGAGGAVASRSAAPVPTKLFVGGLSQSTDNAGLRAAFEEFGEVSDAAVIKDRDTGRSRGFGFVTMADRKDAPMAISALDNSELD